MNIEKDFSRNVWCLLGLPFDAIDINQTVIAVLTSANKNERCFLSTPNLNFLCAAQTDKAFKESVINSDLSIADGFPIVLTAKLLGIPLPQRVAGSDLIEQLYRRNTDVPLKVFFFGGEPGAGEKACQTINQKPAGLTAVGHFVPGFGSVEEMSSPEIIDLINRHDIEFLIIALGAKKGQDWIELNRRRLKAPVISHLGAVINFFAGSVQRAPLWIQKTGLEWLWRIYQEPALWKRYYHDGLCFLKLLTLNVLTYWLWLKFNPSDPLASPVEITASKTATSVELKLNGDCTQFTIAPLRAAFKQAVQEQRDIVLDLTRVKKIDSAFIGLCLILYKHLTLSGRSLKLTNACKQIKRILKWQKVSDVLN